MLTDIMIDVKGDRPMTPPPRYTLASQTLGCLPILNVFLNRLRLDQHLDAALPHDDPRLRLAPAAVIRLVVANIAAGHLPVYALGDWAGGYDPAVLGLDHAQVTALNDDRVGRTLDRLFDADRASLITTTVLTAIREFDLDVTQLHNDSTTVTLTGAYPDADGYVRAGQSTAAIRHGHNKDYRPDLKQLLLVLTVSADGAVPIAYRIEDGNTSDDVTHIPTWDGLVALVGRTDFLYVADSKLCSSEAMGHINAHQGRFVTVIPHARREDTWFRDWAQTHAPTWTAADRSPGPRIGDPDRVYRTFEAPAPSTDGYRVIWVHSSAKAARDSAARAGRIEAGLAAIDAVAARLASPKSRLKTTVALEAAATTALEQVGATRWVEYTVAQANQTTYRQEHRGRPGTQTRYRRTERPVFTISAAVRATAVTYDAVTDGCFPLITNDTQMSPPQVLAAYRYQPNLERRNHLLKGPQLVAPVFLENAHRIEALLLCHFLALLIEALIERQIRTAMKTHNLPGIPAYPELRNCTAPSAPRILEIFAHVQRHHLINDDETVQIFEPELTPLQHKILELLDIPATIYTTTTPTGTDRRDPAPPDPAAAGAAPDPADPPAARTS
jgi:transposase